MNTDSVAEYSQALRDYQLLDPIKLAEIDHLVSSQTDVKTFARELVRRKLLTGWQAQMILQGRAKKLAIGSYLLLEQLGEGGMGKVYKARHRMMSRLVALKVIRKERLGNPEAVRRFRREIQAVAQLTHPNMVLAFDADQDGDVHFFAMEYVDGIDLARLIKDKGALPIREACEYVRQAALGLQHAHERGLVHRDIKPSNLLLTLAQAEALRSTLSGVPAAPAAGKPPSSANFQGVIKILDMGLALSRDVAAQQADSRITYEGLVVGTPDFLAPEQARNSAKADIRSDLYSLGCTLYFLLTAKPPFPEGSPTEKVLKHAMDTPPHITTLRPEIPTAVAAIVHKLMSKNPDERYQTPAELATALEPFGIDAPSPSRHGTGRPGSAAALTITTSDPTTASDFTLSPVAQQQLDDARAERAAQTHRRHDWGLWIPLALGALLLAAVLVVILALSAK